MKLTYDYLKSKGSHAKLILGGWGGGHQLPSLLKGLDRALPKDIIFSCLNPIWGKVHNRSFWERLPGTVMYGQFPWLEGDHQLWHFQPRVHMMREHVKLAAKQNLTEWLLSTGVRRNLVLISERLPILLRIKMPKKVWSSYMTDF